MKVLLLVLVMAGTFYRISPIERHPIYIGGHHHPVPIVRTWR